MSFGFSIGDIIAVSQLANKARKAFVGAPDQFKAISDELRALSIIIQDIDTNLAGYELDDCQESSLQEISTTSRRLLYEVESTVKKYTHLEPATYGIRGSVRRTWQRLKWEPEDVCELRSRITSNITLLDTFLGGINSRVALATGQGIKRLNQRQDDEEREAILDWLTPVDYADQQHDFLGRRQPGTGQWLLDSEEYRQWTATLGKTLFCPGIPGAGKTILTSIIINDINTRFKDDASVAVAYLYCNFRRQHEQKAHALIASILRQLSPSQLPDEVKALYDEHKRQKTRPLDDELLRATGAVMAKYARVFVIIDALDECQFPDRTKMISDIIKLQSTRQLNLCVTSRLIPGVTDMFSGPNYISREIRASSEDIERYIKDHISHLPSFVAKNPILQDEIRDAIIQAADGMFLLAQLHLDSLKGKRSPKAVRESMKRLTTGSGAYDHAYDEAMLRIEGQLLDEQELAKQVLSWIICAKRSLSMTELQHALGVEVGETELDEDNLPDVEDMVSVCAGLVTVDEESGIIRLVHHTTQEYFQRTSERWFPEVQRDIAKTDDDFEKRLQVNKFYDYATHYWQTHIQQALEIDDMVISFLHATNKVESTCQALVSARYIVAWRGYSYRGIEMTGLHLAGYLGISTVVPTLVASTTFINSKDMNGETPLHLAASRGHVEVVKILLEEGADVKVSNIDGETPLNVAAAGGHVDVVELLLEKGADFKVPDHDGNTPFYLAVDAGQLEVVKLLLEKSVDVTVADDDERIPLITAASRGHVEVVKLLLQKGADITVADKHRRTPLDAAASRGRIEVVKVLLENGANITATDIDGWTPFYSAAVNGHIDTAKLLLEKGADITIVDNFENTIIFLAAGRGHVEVVKLLLEKGADIAASNDNGWTPLNIAAGNGCVEVVKLLLEKGADKTAANKFGNTPLNSAIEDGHTEVIGLLLEDSTASHARYS